MSNVTVQTFIVRVECNKPIPHPIDLVAGRTYTVDGVKDVTATRAEQVTLNPTPKKKRRMSTGSNVEPISFYIPA